MNINKRQLCLASWARAAYAVANDQAGLPSMLLVVACAIGMKTDQGETLANIARTSWALSQCGAFPADTTLNEPSLYDDYFSYDAFRANVQRRIEVFTAFRDWQKDLVLLVEREGVASVANALSAELGDIYIRECSQLYSFNKLDDIEDLYFIREAALLLDNVYEYGVRR